MHPTARKVLIAAGIVAGMLVMVFLAMFITWLFIEANTEEFSRA